MSSARSPYLRSEWYDAMRLDPYIDNLLSERSISVHDARRAKMSLGYSGKENPFLEPDIDACIGALVALIRHKYLSAGDAVRPADVGRMAHFLTLDIITKVAYGEAFGFIEGDQDVHEYIRTSEEVVGWITLFAVVPAAQRFINRGWVRRNFGPGPGDKKGIGKLMGYVCVHSSRPPFWLLGKLTRLTNAVLRRRLSRRGLARTQRSRRICWGRL